MKNGEMLFYLYKKEEDKLECFKKKKKKVGVFLD